MRSAGRNTRRAMWRPFSDSSQRTPRTKREQLFLLETLESRIALSNYWVSPSGNDGNPGTRALPWRTLQANVATLVADDTMNVEAGSYTGFIVGWDDTGTY